MSNLLEHAIDCNDGERAAKIIQRALGIEWTTLPTMSFPLMAGRS